MWAGGGVKEVWASCEVPSECTLMVSLISEGVCAHLYSGWPHTKLSISRESLTFFSASLSSLLRLSHPYPPRCFPPSPSFLFFSFVYPQCSCTCSHKLQFMLPILLANRTKQSRHKDSFRQRKKTAHTEDNLKEWFGISPFTSAPTPLFLLALFSRWMGSCWVGGRWLCLVSISPMASQTSQLHKMQFLINWFPARLRRTIITCWHWADGRGGMGAGSQRTHCKMHWLVYQCFFQSDFRANRFCEISCD